MDFKKKQLHLGVIVAACRQKEYKLPYIDLTKVMFTPS